MKQRPPDGDDPTSEEEAPEFDGTHTDRLDDSYRSRVAVASENPHATVRFNDRRKSQLQRLNESEAGSSEVSATVKQLKAFENTASSATVKQHRAPENPLPSPQKETTHDADAGCDDDATGLFVKPPIRR